MITELIYFLIAGKLNIIDKPNHRSSHSVITLRGGGIIFPLALLIYPFYFGLEYKFFLIGLMGIALVSFIDDIKPVSTRSRFLVHIISAIFMFYQLGLFSLNNYLIIPALLLVIGSINAINFMDGINGITGAYAFITLCTFLVINTNGIQFIESSLIITTIISVLVFNIFNFRTRAKCFAGDVGSVGIAFIILFFLLQLIVKTGNVNYLLVLLIYGLDTITTITFRAIRKERILEPHRSHFYQYLANDRKIPHLAVAALYSIAQLLINLVIIFWMPSSIIVLVAAISLCTVAFVLLRFWTEGRTRLLMN